MEHGSIGISDASAKDDQQTITLIESAEINGENGLDDLNPPLIHHVLEASTLNNSVVASTSKKLFCFMCNAKLCASGRGAVDVFSKKSTTQAQNLDVNIAIGNILNIKLQAEEPYSTYICKKCFKLVNTIDSVEKQLDTLKKEAKLNFRKTLDANWKEDNIDSDCEMDTENDVESQIYSVSKSKTKRTRKSKKSRPSLIKLEVKEEADLPGITLTEYDESTADTLDFMDENNKDVDAKIEDYVELDGLDISENDAVLQLTNGSEALLIGQSITLNDGNPHEKYKCKFCTMKGTYCDVQKHLIQKHLERLFECEVCFERLSSTVELLDHLEEHLSTGALPYKCSICDAQFALPRQLKDHIRDHGSKTMSCVECSKKFRSASALQQHTNTHTGNKPYLCQYCNKGFYGKKLLSAHIKTHMVRPRPHQCKICSKSFLTQHHLQDHIKTHDNTKDFICETCGKGFATARSLDLHSLTHTGVKNFACCICNKAFARKGEVEDHERTHTGEKPFQCEICGATFSQRSNLQSHKKATHYKERNYSCELCNRAFKRRRLLNYHRMSVHTGERPFKCSFCSAGFVYPEHYKKHLRIHTGEKPFSCEICHKAFSSRDNKNAHKFVHSNKKQYECKVCGQGFMRKPQLITHIQIHGLPDDESHFIKVNSASAVDAEHGNLNDISIKIEDDNAMSIETLPSMQLIPDTENEGPLSRQLLVDSEDGKYILQTSADKHENVNHFLASIQGQVVEVRENLAYTTELAHGPLTVSGVANQSANNDSIQEESFEIVSKASSGAFRHNHTNGTLLSKPNQLTTIFSHNAKNITQPSHNNLQRPTKQWLSANHSFIDN